MTEIKVGMATCGISAGGESVYRELQNKIAELKLDVTLSETGCMGMCYDEVLVEIIENGNNYLYAHVTPERVQEILNQHIIEKNPVEKWIVKDKTGGKEESFFEVILHDADSREGLIRNEHEIYWYLAQVAPVSFDHEHFKFAPKIDHFLRENVPDYATYDIRVNDRKVYRPYEETVPVPKGTDSIVDVKRLRLFSREEEKQVLAYGWLGIRENCLSRITGKGRCAGIRIRQGGIQIGDRRLLDSCFTEDRFGQYWIGEVHIVGGTVRPSTARNNLADSKESQDFFNAFES